MTTSQISSGFDVELQLGANWFRSALNLLNDKGLLGPPGIPIVIIDVQISFEPNADLQIDVLGLPDPVLATAELSADGTELIIATNIPQIPPRTIPFSALKNLAEPPVLVKRPGDANHDPAIILLANLNIHAEPQKEEPLPPGDFLPRGNADDAQSFLPIGKDIAFGLGKTTLDRFGNNIWHTNLRADDGSHPLPDEDNKRGTWSKVTMNSNNGEIRIKLEGDIPIDSPIIDIVPDPHVTITLTLTPTIIDGKLNFSIVPDTDVDTGLLGDIFGAITGGIAGGLIGFIVGLITGGILSAVLIGVSIGAVIGVIVIEVAEVIVEGIVQKQIKAKLNGEPMDDILCCEGGVVRIATPDSDQAFDLSFLDSIPTSIPIHTAFPEDEKLYKQSLLVTSVYDEFTVDSDGFAVAGLSSTAEKFQPQVVSIASFNYTGDTLTSITYERTGGAQQELLIDEVFDRIGSGELEAPFKIFQNPEDASLRIAEGKLACVCLKPVAIRQEATVVNEIEFEGGQRIKVKDAIALQDAAGIVVTGYQLIHPKDYNAYYRAKADFFLDNNFESLPKISN